MRVLMIVPAYNEEKNIENVVETIKLYATQNSQYDIDYIVINDDSSDRTKEICAEKKIKCINLIQI